MIGMKLLYLLLIAVVLVFYVLYIDTFACILLICVLLLPIVLKVILLCLKFGSAVTLTCDTDTCQAGDSVPIVLSVQNHTPFAFSDVRAVIHLRHSFGTGKEVLRLRFPLQARNSTKMTFYVHADYCGCVDVYLKKIFVLDYFHLFRTRLRIRQRKTSILILPKRLSLPVDNASMPVISPDSDVYGDMPGDDPSEIFGLHEYVPGEPVSRIHWKLSTKADKLLMKEFSSPVQKTVLLLLEYHSSGHSAAASEIKSAETVLTLFYSLSCSMLEQQMLPTILWYHSIEKRMIAWQLNSAEELVDLFRELYDAIGSMEMDHQELITAVTGMRFSSVTCITNRIREPLLRTIENRIDANQKNILLIDENAPVMGFEEADVIRVRPKHISEDIHQLII